MTGLAEIFQLNDHRSQKCVRVSKTKYGWKTHFHHSRFTPNNPIFSLFFWDKDTAKKGAELYFAGKREDEIKRLTIKIVNGEKA
jgi:hypothetical protein